MYKKSKLFQIQLNTSWLSVAKIFKKKLYATNIACNKIQKKLKYKKKM